LKRVRRVRGEDLLSGRLDHDGSVTVDDALRLLSHLFAGDERIAEPYESCGYDPTEDALGCEFYAACP
jgi:hypothetical protein